MFKNVLYLFLVLCFICSCNGDNKDNGYNSDQTPYDPVKAGAVIIEKFDISDSVIFTSETTRIAFGLDLAAHKDLLYIRIEDRIIIFDKQTMVKEKELKINFSEADFSYDLNSWKFIQKLQGLVVTDHYALILIRNTSWSYFSPNYLQLFYIDLETGDTDRIDNMNKFDSEMQTAIWESMGYDKVNNLLWFRLFDVLENIDNSALYFYSYDDETEKFNQNTIVEFFNREYTKDQITGISSEIFINGTDLWTFSRYVYRFIEDKWEQVFTISRRCINNPYEILHEINMGYLGLDYEHLKKTRISESLLFDDPYIWIMVEIENKVQLLKLLPN